jgi:hypothetical protein
MIEDEDDEYGLGIKRPTKDKLTYKNVIAAAIMKCQASRGTTRFSDNVKGLISLINFDIPGYHLKSEIAETVAELDAEAEQRLEGYKERFSDGVFYTYANHYFRPFLDLEMAVWYWDALFVRVIQILANHDLLFERETYISMRKSKELSDEVIEEE